MPSNKAESKEYEAEQNTANSNKEDEDGELDLTGIGKSYFQFNFLPLDAIAYKSTEFVYLFYIPITPF